MLDIRFHRSSFRQRPNVSNSALLSVAQAKGCFPRISPLDDDKIKIKRLKIHFRLRESRNADRAATIPRYLRDYVRASITCLSQRTVFHVAINSIDRPTFRYRRPRGLSISSIEFLCVHGVRAQRCMHRDMHTTYENR